MGAKPLGKDKKSGFIHFWVGGWVRKGSKATKIKKWIHPFP